MKETTRYRSHPRHKKGQPWAAPADNATKNKKILGTAFTRSPLSLAQPAAQSTCRLACLCLGPFSLFPAARPGLQLRRHVRLVASQPSTWDMPVFSGWGNGETDMTLENNRLVTTSLLLLLLGLRSGFFSGSLVRSSRGPRCGQASLTVNRPARAVVACRHNILHHIARKYARKIKIKTCLFLVHFGTACATTTCFHPLYATKYGDILLRTLHITYITATSPWLRGPSSSCCS